MALASVYDVINRHPGLLWGPLTVLIFLVAGAAYFSPTIIGLMRQVERIWALHALNWVCPPVALMFAFHLPSKRTRSLEPVRVRPAMTPSATWPAPPRSNS